jgi:uncharacterized damage-inducible protein DinB/predicted RNase H-like HicB family nuclease
MLVLLDLEGENVMQTYKLYLESGLKKKKTMVHVLELLGCIAKGPTTDEALSRTPGAIRAYLHFLKRHSEAVDPAIEFETIVAEHITQGQWLGNGDPALVFQPDLEPLTPEDAEIYIQRLQWSRAGVLALVSGLNPEQLEAEPDSKDRSIRAMLEHVLDSEYFYLSSLCRIEGLPGPGTIIRKREGDLLAWMSHVRTLEIERIRSFTIEERSQSIEHWKQTWTARKVLRRMLEHEWEHLVELSERLGNHIN